MVCSRQTQQVMFGVALKAAQARVRLPATKLEPQPHVLAKSHLEVKGSHSTSTLSVPQHHTGIVAGDHQLFCFRLLVPHTATCLIFMASEC